MSVPKGCTLAQVKTTRLGRAWIATQTIPQGTTIYTELPLVLTVDEKHKKLITLPWEMTCGVLRNGKLEQYLVKRYTSRSEIVKRSWDDDDEKMCLCFEQQLNIDRSRVLRLHHVVVTNNIFVFDPQEPNNRKSAFFKWFSLINHSCTPNAKLRPVDFATGRMELVASQEIQVGEEITFPYITFSSNTPEEIRRVALEMEYGFTCACTECKK